MKVGILAGGMGVRLTEETARRPKPMVEIGGKPILWHIMSHYATYGFDEFVVALGYKGDFIRRWFIDHASNSADSLRIEFSSGNVEVMERAQTLDWTVELIETGLNTNTGGRIKRLQPYLGDETFLMTWGDGVSTIDLNDLVGFHRSHGRLATLTAVRPPARFGHIELDGDRITTFDEKPQASEGWINGAYFVLEPEVFEYIEDDDTAFERAPLERLAKDGELMAYRHEGFWQCMDTIRDKKRLEELWEQGAPWDCWSNRAATDRVQVMA